MREQVTFSTMCRRFAGDDAARSPSLHYLGVVAVVWLALWGIS